MAKKTFVVKNHVLQPKHVKLNDREKEAVFSNYKITFNELPKIRKNDAALAELDVKEGDVIKIIRQSPTAGEAVYYRGVVDA